MIDKVLAIAIAIGTIIVLVEIWITPPLRGKHDNV